MIPYKTPTRETLELFKAELWKDQRELKTITTSEGHFIIKHVPTEQRASVEGRILRYLRETLHLARVPALVEVGDDYIKMECIRGIRMFNLLVELDRLRPPLADAGATLKRRLLKRCESNEREIQAALAVYPGHSCTRYPAVAKIRAIMRILADAIGIDVEWPTMESELSFMEDMWRSFYRVPFRDATTKNMALAAPELWLGNFDGEESRRRYLVDTISNNDQASWMEATLFDFDFASCTEASTPEDDVISLLYHERTWCGPPVDARALVWGLPPDAVRAAITFIVRYYRFGGRKAAYRLLHPWGHRVRFRHDDDAFYFQRLPEIVISLWPQAERELPHLLDFTRTVARELDGIRTEVDHFVAANLAEERTYYVDMYPQ